MECDVKNVNLEQKYVVEPLKVLPFSVPDLVKQNPASRNIFRFKLCVK